MALLAASLFLTAGVLELGIRALGLGEPPPSGYAPVGKRGLGPRTARGYRDLDRPLAKPKGVRRLLALGDSFTWGVGVEFEDAYPQRLERGLTHRRGETWEAVNLSLPGMNTVAESAQLSAEGFAYDPDIVLLGYVLNDSEDEGAAEARRAADWAAPTPEPRAWERSALLRLVGGRIWATLENRRRVAGYLSMYDDRAPGWIAGQDALRAMAAQCRERGVPLVVVIFPLFGNPLDDGYPFRVVHAKVAAAASAAGARVIDLLPAYSGLRWELLVVDGAADEHPNEIAHRIAADTIARKLDDVLPVSEGERRRP
jgi:hypothetical protein